WPRGEVLLRHAAGGAAHAALDTNLAVQLHPPENQGRPRILRQLTCLSAVVVAEKREALTANSLEQDDAGRGLALSVHRCQHHAAGVAGLHPHGLLQPLLELIDGVRAHHCLVEGQVTILPAERCDVYLRQSFTVAFCVFAKLSLSCRTLRRSLPRAVAGLSRRTSI